MCVCVSFSKSCAWISLKYSVCVSSPYTDQCNLQHLEVNVFFANKVVMWVFRGFIRFRRASGTLKSQIYVIFSLPEHSLFILIDVSIWDVSRKMLMVSVGNLSFFNGGGNFLTLPSGKANQIPRTKGLFAFQSSFLTLPLIFISISLSYLQNLQPLFFWLLFNLLDTLYKAH